MRKVVKNLDVNLDHIIYRLSNTEIEQIKKLNQSHSKQEGFYEKDVALTEKDLVGILR